MAYLFRVFQYGSREMSELALLNKSVERKKKVCEGDRNSLSRKKNYVNTNVSLLNMYNKHTNRTT